MPKKYNSAGKLQEYIPAGNGDPSGEYGTNKGTGNKHIKLGGGTTPNIIDGNEPKIETPKKPPKDAKPKEEKQQPNIIDDNKPSDAKSIKKKNKKIKAEGKTKKEKVDSVNKQTREHITPPFDGRLGYDGMDVEQAEQSGQAVVDVFNDFEKCFKYLKKCGTTAGVKKDTNRMKLSEEQKQKIRDRIMQWESFYRHNFIDVEEKIKKEIEYQETKLNDPNWRVPTNARGACSGSYSNPNSEILIKTNNEYKADERFSYGSADGHLKRFTCDNSAYGVQTHELGHALENVLGKVRETHEEWKQIRDLYLNTPKENMPSRYACTSSSEFIAECVSSHYGEGNNPVAEKVFSIMQSVYKKVEDRL